MENIEYLNNHRFLDDLLELVKIDHSLFERINSSNFLGIVLQSLQVESDYIGIENAKGYIADGQPFSKLNPIKEILGDVPEKKRLAFEKTLKGINTNQNNNFAGFHATGAVHYYNNNYLFGEDVFSVCEGTTEYLGDDGIAFLTTGNHEGSLVLNLVMFVFDDEQGSAKESSKEGK